MVRLLTGLVFALWIFNSALLLDKCGMDPVPIREGLPEYEVQAVHDRCVSGIRFITSKLGETQNWEANIPIRVPCRAVGSSVGSLDFYLANEDGLPVNLMGDRFEAVVVLEYSY